MSQINRPPWGLQYLFGSKNFGRNPSQLAQSVIPSADIAPHMEGELIQSLRNQDTFVGTATLLDVVVPQNEAWKIITASIDFTLASSTELYYAVLEVTSANSPTNEPARVLHLTKSTAIGLGLGATWVPGFPVILLSGSRLRLRLAEQSGVVGMLGTLDVLFVRYET